MVCRMGINVPAEVDKYIINLVEYNGKEYKPALLPDDIKRGQVGACFDFSLLQAFASRGKYQYVEGIAIYKGKTHVHAWLSDGVHAFDPTWLCYDKDKIERPLPVVYLGVALDVQTATSYFLVTERSGIIPNRALLPNLFEEVIERSRKLWQT